MGKLQQVNTDKFNELVNSSDELIIADFYADWCGPCKMIAPILQEISEEVDNVTILKVNVDNESSLAAQYGVRNIPTILFFKGGEIVDKIVGAQAKKNFMELISKNTEATAEVESDESED